MCGTDDMLGGGGGGVVGGMCVTVSILWEGGLFLSCPEGSHILCVGLCFRPDGVPPDDT